MKINNSWIFQDPLEMISTVEIYIHIMKGQNIRINPNNLNMIKLQQAYEVAQRFFKLANVRVVR